VPLTARTGICRLDSEAVVYVEHIEIASSIKLTRTNGYIFLTKSVQRGSINDRRNMLIKKQRLCERASIKATTSSCGGGTVD